MGSVVEHSATAAGVAIGMPFVHGMISSAIQYIAVSQVGETVGRPVGTIAGAVVENAVGLPMGAMVASPRVTVVRSRNSLRTPSTSTVSRTIALTKGRLQLAQQHYQKLLHVNPSQGSDTSCRMGQLMADWVQRNPLRDQRFETMFALMAESSNENDAMYT